MLTKYLRKNCKCSDVKSKIYILHFLVFIRQKELNKNYVCVCNIEFIIFWNKMKFSEMQNYF